MPVRLPLRIFATVFLIVMVAALSLAQQPSAPAASSDFQPAVNEILADTQQRVAGDDATGIVWWLPVEFWEAAARAKGATGAEDTFKALRNYTMMVVAVGNVSGFGNIHWFSEDEIRQNILLQDAAGATYAPLKSAEISGDALGMAAVMRPIFVNALGKMGENFVILFFPAKDKAGKPIAAAKEHGSFSVVMRKLAGPENSWTWNLPLNSLMPPKYCPVGKERVQSNWNFCPWHGVPLTDSKK
jgi:hypothetical protein